jgi:hypothetical protein
MFRARSDDGKIDEILCRLRAAMVDVDEIDDELW